MKKYLIVLSILVIFLSILYKNQIFIIEQTLKILFDIDFENNSKLDNIQLYEKYDFIIIGGGTAGCAVANRLSENPRWNILLIEAGGNENIFMDIPVFAFILPSSKKIDWSYQTEPSNESCLAMFNNSCKWLRGRVLGGSSVLNFMIYTRGHHKDFNKWANITGDISWSYENVLSYFRNFENFQEHDEKMLYGKSGPVTITNQNFTTGINTAFMKAIQENGLHVIDINDPESNQIGVSRIQSMIKNGYRMSSNRAYLPVESVLLKRENLHVKKLSQVTKILINENEKRCNGVEFYANGEYSTVLVTKEVILSAGAINSPQLLMLSGIGPTEHLVKHNIKPIINLPGVGSNLFDHVGTTMVFHSESQLSIAPSVGKLKHIQEYVKHGTGPLSVPGACESLVFLNSRNFLQVKDVMPDLELGLCTVFPGESDEIRKILNIRYDIQQKLYHSLTYKTNRGSFTILIVLLKPKSTGLIRLKSSNPFEAPSIKSNYFQHPDDLETLARGIQFVLTLEDTQAFKDIEATYNLDILPNCEKHLSETKIRNTLSLRTNIDYWRCYCRHITNSIYHFSGTCKMGGISDPMAVVNSKLQVIGMKNLRVADASIMPEITSGHPTSAVYMISEKVADIVKEAWT